MKRMVEPLGYYYVRADVIHSGGPVRVTEDQPDPDYRPRPVGFTADLDAYEEHAE